MSRRIMIDADIIMQIHYGNRPVARILRKMLDDGHTVWVSAEGYQQLTNSSKFPRVNAAQKEMLKDLKITTAPTGSLADRFATYDKNIIQRPITKTQIKDAQATGKPIEPRLTAVLGNDYLTVAHAKAADAELWSMDSDIKNNEAAIRKVLGAKIAPETSQDLALKPRSGWNYRTARRLMQLEKITIKRNGDVIRRNVRSGGPPMPGAPVPIGGPRSARATAGANVAQFVLKGIGDVLNRIVDHQEQEKLQTALSKLSPTIERARQDDPTQGVLLVIYFAQVKDQPESQIKPTGVYMDVRYAFGRTKSEALSNLRGDNSVRPPLEKGANSEVRTQEVFVPPIEEPKASSLVTPFPHVALARFAAGHAQLQQVRWSGLGGFDADGVQYLTMLMAVGTVQNAISGVRNPAVTPEFIVLDPPSTLNWYNGNIRHESDVPVIYERSANGVSLQVVELDDGLLSDEIPAAMIFPADEETALLFGVTPKTRDSVNALRGYTNFDQLRWARPEDIEVIKRF